MPLTTTTPSHDSIISTAEEDMNNATTGEQANAIFKQMLIDLDQSAVSTSTGTGSSPTTGTINTPEVITI